MNTSKVKNTKKLRQAASITKVFSSRWAVNVAYPDRDNTVEESAKDWSDYYDELAKFAEDDFNDIKSHFLEVAQEQVWDKISDISFELQENEANMIVTFTEEPDNDIMEELTEWISGQYSDGWGEGLEDRQASSFREEVEYEEYDEETDETEYIHRFETGYLFVVLWPLNFKLTHN